METRKLIPRPMLYAALLSGAATCLPAQGETDIKKLNDAVQQLMHRVEQLEAANKRLADQVRQGEGAKSASSTANDAQGAQSRSTDLDRLIGDTSVRMDARQQPGRLEQARDGVTVGASVAMVAQSARRGMARGDKSQLNYRADVEVEVPLGKVGAVGGSKLFFHVRAGQGEGLQFVSPTLTATPNTTAFFLQNSDDAATIVGQAWYQFGYPLAPAGSAAQPGFTVTLGKIDLFGFFDRNVIADSETDAFMNNVFVHNPLLDSGGAIGADSYGFQPGMIASYSSDVESNNRWQASLGMFASGAGASFDSSFSRPFLIGQLGYHGQIWHERAGNYRLYAWTNGSFTPYNNPLAGSNGRTTGIGLSIDQQLAEDLTIFTRYGHAFSGDVRFDRAITLGAQLAGRRWGRQDDHAGLAFGWLNTSARFRTAAPTLDGDGDNIPDFGYRPGGAEKNIELYYAWRVHANLQISPRLQWITQPGGDAGASNIWSIGLRAVAGF